MSGTYWSVTAYKEWQDSPVLTTLVNPALPIEAIEFPAVTICSPGMNEDLFKSAVLKKFLEFAKTKGMSRDISPIVAETLIYQKVCVYSYNRSRLM